MNIKKLKPNDTIGIICPAFSIPANSPRFASLESYFKSLGFNIKYGQSVFASLGYLAGSDNLRAKDIEEMFLDKEVKAILCMKGGYGCSRIVDLIDYQIIRDNPKLFIGFSDVTVLLNAINQRAKIPTIHGMVGIYLGSPNIDSESLKDFENLITLNQSLRVLKNPNNNAITLSPGVARGQLIGGNLSLINTLIGTDYDLDFKGKIVFIEEVEEAPYRIDRYLSTLRLAKKLEQAKGFVLGYFTDCKSDHESWSYLDILKQYFENLNKPVLASFASGHDFPFINLPIGLEVELDADQKTITIMEELYETN